ncbi:MAG: cytochrome c maturation protein CcmE [Chloroflexi bacterium]|nr:cytochrome c maturation protein CcmE [Chloroflexota bacterium]
MLKRKKFFIGGLMLVVAMSYLGFMGFQNSATYYYTVSEALAQGNAIYERNLRINGLVVDGSVERVPATSTISFLITEADQTIKVVFSGVVPDTFKDSADVVVEGRFDETGVFQAKQLLAKCPSRYEPEEVETTKR